MRLNRKAHGGFTLVEIMIALAIFAVTSATLIRNAGMAARQTSILEERTVAYWVAENRLNEIRMAAHDEDQPEFPGLGSDRYTVTMADRDWELAVNVESTENEFMRRVDVEVYPVEGRDDPLVTLTGFVGRY